MDDNASEDIIEVLRLDVECIFGDEVIEVEGLGEIESGINFDFLENIQVKNNSLQIDNHNFWELAEISRFLYFFNFFLTDFAKIVVDFFRLDKLL